MKLPNAFKALLMQTVDSAMALVPQKAPTLEKLRDCKIIAHRGFCDQQAKENTLAAFKRAHRAGVWGAEFDIRWTKDDVAVVHHDATAKRVFGDDCEIGQMLSTDIRKRLPDIPFLSEVLTEVGGRLHLMIELKGDSSNLTSKRLAKLKAALIGLHPVLDYHFMGLKLDALLACKFVPREALLPIAEFNVASISRAAIAHGMGGVTAQYCLINHALIERHHAAYQKIGTGFATSRSVLFRELNRDVDWIFSDYPDQMLSIVKEALQAMAPAGI
jgi:glycerophosphoryl diester phosphodiesterase